MAPDGRVDVVYYDRRADTSNVQNEVSYQASFDGAESFEPRVRLSDETFSSEIGFGGERGLADLGSRLGLVSTGDRALAIWTDTRAGTRTTSKQDLARGLIATNDPRRLAGWLEALLRYGGILVVLLGLALVATAAAVATGRGRRSTTSA